jgi:hypothetical protein
MAFSTKLWILLSLALLTTIAIILLRLSASTLHLIALTLLTLLVVTFLAVALFYLLLGREYYLTTQANRHKAQREAGLAFHSTPLGDYIYRSKAVAKDSEIIPGHLLSAPYNGAPSAPTAQDEQKWLFYTTRNSPKLIEGQSTPLLPVTQELPPLLPILLKTQRLIVGGGSDSGKSTLAKHLIAGRTQDSQIIPIDPHSPSKLLGIDVIGAGRNWQAIGQALESLELLMHDRYSDVAAGLMGYFQHDKISIFIDEWTSIVEEVPDAGKRLKTLLTESRKVNMFLTLLTHATTLDGLGLPSAQLKKSALIVELVGGNGEQPYRAFVHPQTSIGVDGKKAKPTEYQLPGPFSGYPDSQDILPVLPSPQLIKLQRMANEGMSRRAMIKVLYPEIDNPGKRHYALVDELLSGVNGANKGDEG